jgi:hypothetical protein
LRSLFPTGSRLLTPSGWLNEQLATGTAIGSEEIDLVCQTFRLIIDQSQELQRHLAVPLFLPTGCPEEPEIR